MVAARPPTGRTKKSATEWPSSCNHFSCAGDAAIPSTDRVTVTRGRTVQSMAHRIDAKLAILETFSSYFPTKLLFFSLLSPSSKSICPPRDTDSTPFWKRRFFRKKENFLELDVMELGRILFLDGVPKTCIREVVDAVL